MVLGKVLNVEHSLREPSPTNPKAAPYVAEQSVKHTLVKRKDPFARKAAPPKSDQHLVKAESEILADGAYRAPPSPTPPMS
jgi:hypothetical protein